MPGGNGHGNGRTAADGAPHGIAEGESG